MRTNKLQIIQCFRAIAAIGVVFHHASLSTNAFVEKIPPWLDIFFSRGYLGVDFFFVLSGFIILSSHLNDEKSISSLRKYCIKRSSRIFPPYWPVSISLVALYMSLPNVSAGTRTYFSLLSSFLLLPDWAPPALSVAWTLIHEMLFYTVFMLFYLSNTLFVIFVAGWTLTIATFSCFTEVETLPPLLRTLLEPINLEFVAGMGVAYLTRRLQGNRYGLTMIFFGVASFTFISTLNVSNRIMYAIPFSALVLGGALLEIQKSIIVQSWLVLLGDASYSIYLVHNPLLSVISRVVGHVFIISSWWFAILFGVISSVCIGILYHKVIEKPSIFYFRQLLERYTGRMAWQKT